MVRYSSVYQYIGVKIQMKKIEGNLQVFNGKKQNMYIVMGYFNP